MAHYAHMISVNRLNVAAHIGFYAGERAQPQNVEICFRLYFAQAPAAATDDEGAFIDYGTLCAVVTDYNASREFNLVEFMSAELHRHLRGYLDAHEASHVRLWLRVNKIQAPVVGLQGGASFTVCDLGPGDTIASHT